MGGIEYSDGLPVEETPTTETTTGKLTNLAKEVQETLPENLPYGLDGIKEAKTGKFFEKILENENNEKLKFLLGLIALEKLGERFNELGEAQKTTFEIVVWNKIMEGISLKIGAAYVGEKITEKFKGAFEFFRDIVGENTDGEEKIDESKGSIEGILGRLKKLAEGSSDEKEIGSGIIDEFSSFVGFLTGNYYQNMSNLIDIAKKNNLEGSEEFKRLLENPQILSEILETGKYDKNGFSIDITNIEKPVFVISGRNNLEQAKKDFMKIALNNTINTGKKIDNIQKQTDKLANFFTKIGFSSRDLQAFVEKLKGIPIIGEFLALVVGFFIGDSLYDEMDMLQAGKKYKKPISNFIEFLGDNTNEVPFDKAYVYSDDDKKNIVKFLVKVEEAEKPHKTDEKIPSVVMQKDFWKKIFSKDSLKGKGEEFLEAIRLQIVGIKGDESDISQEKFFEKMAILKIEYPKTAEASVHPSPAEASPLSSLQSGEGEESRTENGEPSRVLSTENTSSEREDGSGENGDEPKNGDLDSGGFQTPEGQTPEVVEVAPKLSLEEQLNDIKSLPVTLEIEGTNYEINIIKSGKQISIKDEKGLEKTYKVEIKVANFDVFQEIKFSQNNGFKLFIKSGNFKLENAEIAKMLITLVENESFNTEGTIKGNITYKLNIKKI